MGNGNEGIGQLVMVNSQWSIADEASGQSGKSQNLNDPLCCQTSDIRDQTSEIRIRLSLVGKSECRAQIQKSKNLKISKSPNPLSTTFVHACSESPSYNNWPVFYSCWFLPWARRLNPISTTWWPTTMMMCSVATWHTRLRFFIRRLTIAIVMTLLYLLHLYSSRTYSVYHCWNIFR